MATPTLIQHVAGSSTGGIIAGQDGTVSAGGSYNLPLPNASLAGNCLIVGVNCDNTNTPTLSVTDDKSNSYTKIAEVVDTTNGTRCAVFVALNVAAGTTVIHASPSTAADFFEVMCSEFNNVALASATDGNHTAFVGSGSSSIAAGSFTTTVAGDLIYQYMCRNSGTTPSTYTSGSGFTFLSVDSVDGHAAQYQIQSSAGAINPTITVNSNIGWATVAIALKSASAGTARPTGIRVLRLQHLNTKDETSATVASQTPTSDGNLMVVCQYSGATYTISSISDGTNTYTSIGSLIVSPDGACMFYSKNFTPSNTGNLTLSMTGTSGGHGSTFLTYEIVGASSNPLDTNFGVSGFASASGNQTPGGAGGPVTTFTATPTGPNQLTLSCGSVAADTATGWNSPSFASQIPATYSGQTNPTYCDENNPAGIGYNGSDTSAQTWTFTHDTLNSAGVGTWVVVGASFIAAPAGGGSTPVIAQRVAYGSDGMTTFSNVVG